ncbi:MAG: hypothetical protein ACK5Q3_19275 [Planctomycetota bacterium]|jgi:hypothetical protein
MIFWPGLSAAWRSGSFRGLAVALLFVFGLQTAWIGTFVWPSLLSAWEAQLLWWALAASVLGSIVYQAYYLAKFGDSDLTRCSDRVLTEAQSLYLQGSYFEAEELLSPHVSHMEWDVEAALWMASIYRRTGRFEAAILVLQTLESLERAQGWAAEIAQEQRKIKEIKRNKRLESL